jgi:ABC-2 type transport system permease protein
MRSFRLVARHEYAAAVRRRSFLLSTLGLPAFFAIILGLSLLAALDSRDAGPVGVVDAAGVLVAPPAGPLAGYPDEASARAALDGGAIGGYFVIAPDYRSAGAVRLVYAEAPPNPAARGALEAALRAGLVADQPEAIRRRLTGGVDLAIRSADGRRELSQSSIFTLLVPLVAGLMFSFATMNSAGYMVQAVATEKENRTAEVLASTVSPAQLIGGKALGLMAVALTQLLIWLALAALPAAIGIAAFGGADGMALPWGFVALAVAFFLPAFALIAGIMTAVGSIVDEAHQGQQIAGTLNLLFVVPFFFIPLVFANPHSPLLVALTLFPTTAYLTVLMRWAVAVIPGWQLALSFAILATSAVLSVWVAARIFRSSMLRHGQAVSLRGAWRSFLAAG